MNSLQQKEIPKKFTMDKHFWSNEINNLVEIIHKQLYFAILKENYTKKPKSTLETFYFSIDEEMVYQNYYCDFGPLNMSCLYRYCYKLNKYLEYAKGLKSIVHVTSSNPEKKTNAAFLLGSFCVIYLNMHPKDVHKILLTVGPYKQFLDASQCPNQYTIKLNDCFHALAKAITINFFNFNDFNISEYDTHDKLQFGDMNWLLPRKFLAFVGPTDNEYLNSHPPQFYVKYFLKNDVKTVVRLNSKTYDSSVFTGVGIEHIDLIFPDGTTPPKDVLLRFLNIAETAPAAIAVHCKAGLGRTGSLIGAYIVKHYRLTAKEAIAWMRICRPGSVIGQQQGWLEKIETWLWRTGTQYRMRRYGEGDKIPYHMYGIYSKQWPIEREKIIREARKRLQTTFTQSQFEKMAHTQKRQSASADNIGVSTRSHKISKRLLCLHTKSSFNSISKILSSVHGLENDSIIASSNSVLATSSINNVKIQTLEMKTTDSDITNKSITKLLAPKVNFRKKAAGSSLNKAVTTNELLCVRKLMPNRKDNRKTQGDKLVEIKASRGTALRDVRLQAGANGNLNVGKN